MSETIDDGGPAFPSQYAVQFPGTPDERLLEPLTYGMTLRDYLAAACATGYIAAFSGEEIMLPSDSDVAKTAYKYADAMLKARKQ